MCLICRRAGGAVAEWHFPKGPAVPALVWTGMRKSGGVPPRFHGLDVRHLHERTARLFTGEK